MPTFDTPQPISMTLSLGYAVANIRISASDRTDTTVDIQPGDVSSKADVKVAEQTRIDYADGKLIIKTPRIGSIFSRPGAIDVTIALPTGSRLHGESGMGEIRCDGRLGDCRFKTGYGEIHLAAVGAATLTTGTGDLTVDHIDGAAEVTNANGSVRIGRIDGAATIKNSNGATWVGEVTGDIRITAANGGITVDRADAGVTAKTANGSVRVGEVVRGSVALETAAGSLDVGVRAGTAVWLDLNTSAGRVRNELAAASGPDNANETVEVRARTYIGDIIIRRP